MRIVRAEVFYVAVPYIPSIRKYRPDEHTERPIYLGRETRIATADQRIICYAKECAGQILV